MEIKYKLIKTYPNSPKLGTIATKIAKGDCYVYENDGRIVQQKLLEENPEYWFKIVAHKCEIKYYKKNVPTIIAITRVDGQKFKIGNLVNTGNNESKSIKAFRKETVSGYERLEYCCGNDKWYDIAFAEKVVIKDYKILQMKNSHGWVYSLSEQEVLNEFQKTHETIYSIKRLSDGEI